ncbi:ArsR/SmtB family transcription factor [Yinghuangia seranimata]|uniref:ArsR/SmtB family transcription factor n=1 Tax=Yinghuangia seranimata TaxID=408067 RepID=UPI00248D1570|nr:DUF5937 family protein [Yinghuangia seranimata]MDI2129909.1 DUF5937 family protein [Yinghuangia seranimata]
MTEEPAPLPPPRPGGSVDVAFTVEDVARIRFAVSPLWEVVTSVRVLKGSDTQGLHRRWQERAIASLRAAKLDVAPLFDLVEVPTYAIPSFLVPPPATTQPSLEVELAAVRATPPERLRASAPGVRPAVARLREDPEGGLARLTETIAAYWELTLAPYWPRIQALVDDDIRYRARMLAEGGARRLFEDIDPGVTWDAGTLRIRHRYTSGPRRLDGRGLLLVPSAFIWPRTFSVLGFAEWQPTLRYPPRGIGTLWEPRREVLSDALAGVLGRTRAALLTELASPASTTELAGRVGVTPGGVSQHLTALRAAGLVSAHRTGRVVLYARTAVGEALAAANTPVPR